MERLPLEICGSVKEIKPLSLLYGEFPSQFLGLCGVWNTGIAFRTLFLGSCGVWGTEIAFSTLFSVGSLRDQGGSALSLLALALHTLGLTGKAPLDGAGPGLFQVWIPFTEYCWLGFLGGPGRQCFVTAGLGPSCPMG